MEHRNNEWLSISEAVHQLKVGRTTLQRWVNQGRLTAYRVGPKTVRIRRSDLQQLIRPVRDRRAGQDHDPGGEVVSVKETHPASEPISATSIPPLTEEQQQHALAAVEAARALLARQRAKRGGVPFADESWPLIRAAREERADQLR